MMIGGLKFPITCAVAGAIYLVGRIVYQQQYATGVPNNRNRAAALIYFPLFTMVGCCIRLAIGLINGTA
jgi:glutathione S-transferase